MHLNIYIYSKPSQILGYGILGESYIDDNDNVPFLLLQVWKPAPKFKHKQPQFRQTAIPFPTWRGVGWSPKWTATNAADRCCPSCPSSHQHPSRPTAWWASLHVAVAEHRSPTHLSCKVKCVAMETKKIVMLKQSEQFIPKLPDSNATL